MKIILPNAPRINERVTRRAEMLGEDMFGELQPVNNLKEKVSLRMQDYMFNVVCINNLFKLARDFSHSNNEGMGCYETAKDMVEKFRKKMIDLGNAQYDALCDAQLELIEIERRKYQKDMGVASK